MTQRGVMQSASSCRLAPPWLSVVLLAATLTGCGSGSVDNLLKQGHAALDQGNLVEAEQLALRALQRDATSAEALLLAGDAAEGQSQYHRALKYFRQIREGIPAIQVQGACRAATVLMVNLGSLSEAEEQFRHALQLDPADTTANDGLAYLLSLAGRRWEAAPYFLELIKQGHFELGHLHGLAVLEVVLGERERLEECRLAQPSDPLPRLGLATLAMAENRPAEARELLEVVVSDAPELLEAQARYGHLLADSADTAALAQWESHLPKDADEFPEIWVVRARRAQQLGERRGAVRCYLEALRRNANHQRATYQASQLLSTLGETEMAEKFGQRSQLLVDYSEVISRMKREQRDVQLMERAAHLTQELGRLWEAQGWARAILAIDPDNSNAEQLLSQATQALQPDTPQTLRSANPAWQVDLAAWPLPADRPVADGRDVLPAPRDATVRFEDVAPTSGLAFQYFNGHDPHVVGPRLYEVDGGGVGILDYDGDGWPDIYLTQGSAWPPRSTQTRYLDRLFRNVGGVRFEDVTENAGIRENGFSQGVAIGDFDGDGFPDIFIANIGANRLLHNCGDGTFEDVTLAAGLRGEVWTSSCAIADLDGDGLPDIYEVNYLRGNDVFERVCPDARGTPRICPPLLFEPEQDQLYLNQGDGTFVERGAEAGIHVAGGKGLGIVAADFDDTGRLSLFVANDVVANFYFHNETPGPGAPLRFREQALLKGLAVDEFGFGQACMGVAVDDADQDGRLDLFVTNFYQESNTLYLQRADGMFIDATRTAQLRDASYLMLGFGTQFLDAERDGLPDLVVANGHLVDETDLGAPYRMLPQYFRNLGGGRFQRLEGRTLGDYFTTPVLGRALARLDFNRDGLEDFAVTHLDTPAALLANRTTNAGHFLAVKLVGVRSSRDAVGAKVMVRTGDRARRRQLVAGDGYQASNQKQLVFGLGDYRHADELAVTWPSGLEQHWQAVEGDAEWLIVEGDHQLVRLTVERQ